jgi:putative heme transporter
VPERRARARTILRGVLALVVVVVIFFGVLPQLADLERAGAALAELSVRALTGVVALAVGVLLATWVALARLIDGATVPQAGIAHLLSTTVANTVPAGGAVAIGVNLRVHATYGRTVAQTTTGLLTMGVLDNAVKLGLPVVLVALAPVVPGAEALPRSAALGALGFSVVAVVAIVALGREPVVMRVASGAQRLAARWRRGSDGDWPAAAVAYLGGLRHTLRRHGPSAALAVATSHVLQVALLFVALRALGVPAEHAGLVRVTVVYVLVRLVTALPVTPGGLGVAELGIVAGLRAGVPPGFDEPIVAAALLFRVATYLLPILLAAPAWAAWRATRR